MYKNVKVKTTKEDKYFISFIEEGIFNPKYEGYVGGRCEIYAPGQEYYAIEEIRFFTKDKTWYDFREKWDFKEVTKKKLDELRKIINEKYYTIPTENSD